MKKIKLLLLSGLIIFAGCTDASEPEITMTTEKAVIETTNITTITTKAEITPIVEPDIEHTYAANYYLDVLGLIRSSDSDEYSLFTLPKSHYEPDTFKKYFFGKWKSINGDDYIDENGDTLNSTGDIVWISDEIVFTYHLEGGVFQIFWININEPDYLYHAHDIGIENETDDSITFIYYGKNPSALVYYRYGDENTIYNPDMMSRFRLAELCDEYGIYPEKNDVIYYKTYPFTEMRYTDENGIEHFKHDPYFLSNIYLESKNEDEIILSTRMYSRETESPSVTVRFRVFNDGEKWTNEVIEFVGENQRIKNEAELENSLLSTIGYTIKENGDVYLNKEASGEIFDWNNKEHEIDLYRKYYFGKWKYSAYNEKAATLIIDDSNKNNVYNWLTGGIHLVGENILASISNTMAGSIIYWIDINNPNIMYSTGSYPRGEDGHWLDFNINDSREDRYGIEICVYTKISDEINVPPSGYLSQLKQYELMVKYGINKDLLFEYTYFNEELDLRAWKMEQFNTPTYLVSENSDEIIIKTLITNAYKSEIKDINVTFTFKYLNSEWIRDIELNENDLPNPPEKVDLGFDYNIDFVFKDISVIEAKRRFGEPIEINDEYDKLYAQDFKLYKYNDISIYFSKEDNPNNSVSRGIWTDKPTYSLARDIYVGDSFESVLEKLPDLNNEIVEMDGFMTKYLYGEYNYNHSRLFGFVRYDDNDKPLFMRCLDRYYYWCLILEFDEDKNVSYMAVMKAPTFLTRNMEFYR